MGNQQLSEKIFRRRIFKEAFMLTVIHSIAYIFIWFSIFSYIFKYIPLKLHIQGGIYLIFPTIIIVKEALEKYKFYRNDKKNRLKKLIMEFEYAAKSDSCNDIRYNLIRNLKYNEKVALKAEIKSGLGIEFIIPLILTCLIAIFNVASANKDMITYTPAQKIAIEEHILTMMMSDEDITLEAVNEKDNELKQYYKEESVKDFLSLIGQFVLIGVVFTLYFSSIFIKHIRNNKYILTYLEEVK